MPSGDGLALIALVIILKMISFSFLLCEKVRCFSSFHAVCIRQEAMLSAAFHSDCFLRRHERTNDYSVERWQTGNSDRY
jgi:hypothetical protein